MGYEQTKRKGSRDRNVDSIDFLLSSEVTIARFVHDSYGFCAEETLELREKFRHFSRFQSIAARDKRFRQPCEGEVFLTFQFENILTVAKAVELGDYSHMPLKISLFSLSQDFFANICKIILPENSPHFRKDLYPLI